MSVIRKLSGLLEFMLIMGLLLLNTGSAQVSSSHSLQGKVLVGYQGWFRCPNDGSPDHSWSHWATAGKTPGVGTWDVDLFPDVSGMTQASLCAVPGVTVHGQQAYVFSSFSQATTDNHFRLMRENDIDGALMQRFVVRLSSYHTEDDAVLRHALISANKNGRVIAVEYDLTGANAQTLLADLRNDWTYLNQSLQLTGHPSYLKQGNKPLVSLWGLGFNDPSHVQDPRLALQIIQWFKLNGAIVMGGVPAFWSSHTQDSAASPDWDAVYHALDVVQPWTVGRYRSTEEVDAWATQHLHQGIAMTKSSGQLYMPVIFPGFSWHNRHAAAKMNEIPRAGGAFFLRQAMDARANGATMLKIAMFDELNEGTAILKVAVTQNDVPAGDWVTLDADGKAASSGEYLREAKQIATMFHSSADVRR